VQAVLKEKNSSIQSISPCGPAMKPSSVTRMLTMIFLKVFSSLYGRCCLQIASTDTLFFQNREAQSEMPQEAAGKFKHAQMHVTVSRNPIAIRIVLNIVRKSLWNMWRLF
jgi:hypothetical protein